VTVVHGLPPGPIRRHTNLLRAAGIVILYFAIAAVCTRPLLELRNSHIASDPYDPILNASILWWNATTVPFTRAWWSPPYFYPAEGVTAFTENLVGISVYATPIYWITRNPLTAYNLSLFLTWPLSACAVHLLVWLICRRHDAALLAGLSYGFTPYRTAEFGHIQMVTSQWLPLLLVGLHGYLQTSRMRWLTLAGSAWLIQSLANGYYFFFGGVIAALWVAYFCSTRQTRRTAIPIVTALAIAALPLIPVLWKYHVIHERYGLRRSFGEAVEFSAPTNGFAEVEPHVWLWSHLLPQGDDNLFPGATALLLVAAALAVSLFQIRGALRPRRYLRLGLGGVLVLSLAGLFLLLTIGPFRVEVLRVTIRMSDVYRSLACAIVSGTALIAMTPRLRAALARRSPFVFYVAATVAMAILSLGPMVRVRDAVIMNPAPYGWLMHVPGFDQLRVPTRFWMAGTMCLAVAAALAFVRLPLARPAARTSVFLLALAGLGVDSWLYPIPMAVPPPMWPKVERRDTTLPVIELPLGPDWDAAATFRSIWHRRRVANGVSGYDPPHYIPLMHGLDTRDPAILIAMASLGSFDVVVDGAQDRNGELGRYAMSVPGAAAVATDGVRTAYRIPAIPREEVVLGAELPLAGVRASGGDAARMADGRLETEWHDGPQRPGEWVILDIGAVREVGGINESLGEYARDFSRGQAIDVSTDGAAWDEVWRGNTLVDAFLASVRGPTEASIKIAFSPRPARYVRLRQLVKHKYLWRVAELRAHAPAPAR
jgi:F5/8 type C domain-containing protein